MQPLFIDESLKNKTVAVAVSGGEDSMALLHFTLSVKEKYSFNVVCINVEHGIRGESSLKDSEFVRNYCEKNGVPCISYSVNSLKKAETEKLTVEQAARILRYECFNDAFKSGKCDVIFTAHHLKDNMESVLINLFRGTGIKGLAGVTNYGDVILRPFIGVKKQEISEYVKLHNIPFVTDETNLRDDYTRNYIRHNVIPAVEKAFPEAESGVYRLSRIAAKEDAYLDRQAAKIVSANKTCAEIRLPADPVLIRRAAIICFKKLGIERDYERVHAEDVCALADKETGKSVNLPQNVVAIREYDVISLFKNAKKPRDGVMSFGIGEFTFGGKAYAVIKTPAPKDLASGLFVDGDKIPADAVVRNRRSGDHIKKFGGGTKNLSDYYSDLKIPRKDRDDFPVIAVGSRVLAIFGVAVSLDVKVDKKTENVLQLITRKG